ELVALRDKKSKIESTRTIGKSATSLNSSYSVNADTLTDTPASNPGVGVVGLADGRAAVDNVERTASPALSDKARGKRPQLESQTSPNDLPETRDSGDSNSALHSLPLKLATGKKGAAGAKAPTHQFQPSEEWVFSWLPDLPLDPIISVLDALSEHIGRIAGTVENDTASASAEHPETLATDNKDPDSRRQHQPEPADFKAESAGDSMASRVGSTDPTLKIIHWLSSDAMAEALPDLDDSMPEIRPRLQGMSPALVVWFRSLLWSMVYASGVKPFGIWKNTR
ncbi:hypothetical protein GGI23_007785, partial [Coemansia sp. RSA 2559]